jgi:hypothetical protein
MARAIFWGKVKGGNSLIHATFTPSPGARCRRSGSDLRRAGLHHDRTEYAYYKRDSSLESKKDYPSFSRGPADSIAEYGLR